MLQSKINTKTFLSCYIIFLNGQFDSISFFIQLGHVACVFVSCQVNVVCVCLTHSLIRNFYQQAHYLIQHTLSKYRIFLVIQPKPSILILYNIPRTMRKVGTKRSVRVIICPGENGLKFTAAEAVLSLTFSYSLEKMQWCSVGWKE